MVRPETLPSPPAIQDVNQPFVQHVYPVYFTYLHMTLFVVSRSLLGFTILVFK